jgi:hypothetical protein
MRFRVRETAQVEAPERSEIWPRRFPRVIPCEDGAMARTTDHRLTEQAPHALSLEQEDDVSERELRTATVRVLRANDDQGSGASRPPQNSGRRHRKAGPALYKVICIPCTWMTCGDSTAWSNREGARPDQSQPQRSDPVRVSGVIWSQCRRARGLVLHRPGPTPSARFEVGSEDDAVPRRRGRPRTSGRPLFARPSSVFREPSTLRTSDVVDSRRRSSGPAFSATI